MKSPLSNLLIIWIGQLISNIGNGMTAFALGIYVYQKSGSLVNFSFILLCQFLPAILLRPLGGVFADRYSRKFMIMLGDLGSAIGVFLILLAITVGEINLGRVYLGLVISSCFVAIQNPAYKAIISDIVVAKDFARVSGLVQLSASSQHLISPLLAGFILAISGIKVILYIDISSFVFAIVSLALLGKTITSQSRKLPSNIWYDLREGWKYLLASKLVITIVIIISWVTFFVGMIQSLLTPMLLTITDAKNIGIIQSISASGMLLSSLYIGLKSFKIHLSKLLVWSMFFAGILMSLLGIFTNLIVITLLFFLFFGLLPFINTGAEVIIRQNIVNEGQGRVWGMIGFISQIGYLLAYLTSGWLAEEVFNPLMASNSKFMEYLGSITDFNQAQGIAIMFLLAGLFWLGLTIISRFRIKEGEKNVNV